MNYWIVIGAVFVVLLFLIGGWAVVALCGYAVLTDRPTPAVNQLAKIMLLCWPVGILTLAGAWLLRRDVKRRTERDA